MPTDLEPFVVQPSRYSMSHLQAGERCLLAAKMARDLDTSGEYAVLGTIFHEIAATIANIAVLQEREYVEEAEAVEIAQRVMAKPEEARPMTPGMYEELLEFTRRFAQRVSFNPAADVFAVEIPMRHDLEGLTLSARLDRLEITGDYCEIIDYKTGPAFPPSPEELRKDIQLKLYAWHAWQDYGDLSSFGLRQYNPRHQRMVPMDPPFTLEDLQRFDEWLHIAVARLDLAWETGDFPPTPGSWCANCPAPNRCPLPRDIRPASITTDEEAVQQLQAALVEKASAEKRIKGLKAYCKARGIEAVQTGDKEYSRNVTIPKPKLDIDQLKDAGIDVEPFMVQPDPSERWDIRRAVEGGGE